MSPKQARRLMNHVLDGTASPAEAAALKKALAAHADLRAEWESLQAGEKALRTGFKALALPTNFAERVIRSAKLHGALPRTGTVGAGSGSGIHAKPLSDRRLVLPQRKANTGNSPWRIAMAAAILVSLSVAAMVLVLSNSTMSSNTPSNVAKQNKTNIREIGPSQYGTQYSNKPAPAPSNNPPNNPPDEALVNRPSLPVPNPRPIPEPEPPPTANSNRPDEVIQNTPPPTPQPQPPNSNRPEPEPVIDNSPPPPIPNPNSNAPTPRDPSTNSNPQMPEPTVMRLGPRGHGSTGEPGDPPNPVSDDVIAATWLAKGTLTLVADDGSKRTIELGTAWNRPDALAWAANERLNTGKLGSLQMPLGTGAVAMIDKDTDLSFDVETVELPGRVEMALTVTLNEGHLVHEPRLFDPPHPDKEPQPREKPGVRPAPRRGIRFEQFRVGKLTIKPDDKAVVVFDLSSYTLDVMVLAGTATVSDGAKDLVIGRGEMMRTNKPFLLPSATRKPQTPGYPKFAVAMRKTRLETLGRFWADRLGTGDAAKDLTAWIDKLDATLVKPWPIEPLARLMAEAAKTGWKSHEMQQFAELFEQAVMGKMNAEPRMAMHPLEMGVRENKPPMMVLEWMRMALAKGDPRLLMAPPRPEKPDKPDKPDPNPANRPPNANNGNRPEPPQNGPRR